MRFAGENIVALPILYRNKLKRPFAFVAEGRLFWVVSYFRKYIVKVIGLDLLDF